MGGLVCMVKSCGRIANGYINRQSPYVRANKWHVCKMHRYIATEECGDSGLWAAKIALREAIYKMQQAGAQPPRGGVVGLTARIKRHLEVANG